MVSAGLPLRPTGFAEPIWAFQACFHERDWCGADSASTRRRRVPGRLARDRLVRRPGA